MTFSTSVYPDKLIICTHQGQQHHGEEAFVVVEHTAWVVWFPGGYVLATQGPQDMRNIPPVLELLVLLCPWQWHDFILQLLYDGLTDLLHTTYHCAVATPEVLLEDVLPVSCSQVSECRGQLHSGI